MPFSPEQYANVQGHSCLSEMAYVLSAVESQLDSTYIGKPVEQCDPLRLLEVARLNKVLSCLTRNLKYPFAETDSLFAFLDQKRLQTLSLNRRGIDEAAKLSHSLNASGIVHMHFKGPLQQAALYGDPFRKPSGDIDILVAAADRRIATEVIVGAGYEIFDASLAIWWWQFLGELHLKNAKTGLVVDLHHDVQQVGLPRPQNSGGFLERRVSIDAFGDSFDVPSAADRVIIAAISIAKALRSHEPCLSAVVDLRVAMTTLSRSDRLVLEQLSHQSGMEHTLALGLRVVEAVFSTKIPKISKNIYPFSSISDDQLKQMIVVPWTPDLPWPRSRDFIFELSGRRIFRSGRESLRLVLSEGLRTFLEFEPRKDSPRT